jgi:hypothetical protein
MERSFDRSKAAKRETKNPKKQWHYKRERIRQTHAKRQKSLNPYPLAPLVNQVWGKPGSVLLTGRWLST